MKQKRFQSKVLWIAVLSQVIAILLMTNVISIADSEIVNNVATAVLELFTLFGVVNNPTNESAL